MERVKRSTTMASALLLLTGIARLGAAPGVEPLSVTGTLNPGACMTVTKTVHTPAILPKPDIIFLVDTTGSMQPAINNLKTKIGNILNTVLAAQPDAQFGVAEYKDFNQVDNQYGYNDPYAYRLNQALTANTNDVVNNGITPLAALGGHDIPEANLYALTQVAGLPFRSGSSRIVVWFGDAPGHDPSPSPVGDTMASTKAALIAAGIKVIAVDVATTDTNGPGLNITGQAADIATNTGGIFLSGLGADVETQILAGLQKLLVTVTADTSDCGAGVTVHKFGDPTSTSVTVVSGDDAVFTETICLSANAPCGGKVECLVQWLLNGIAPTVGVGLDPNFIQDISINVFCPPPAGCNLYPIALNVKTVAGKIPGQSLGDIYNGSQSGNFGWLTWAGSPSEPTLTTSLTPPGNSSTYVNPNNAADHVVSVGDWVHGKPGVSNGKSVRDALDVLKTIDIDVPIWDRATGSGNNTLYHVVGFAKVRITDYRLPNQNRITATYLGPGCVPKDDHNDQGEDHGDHNDQRGDHGDH